MPMSKLLPVAGGIFYTSAKSRTMTTLVIQPSLSEILPPHWPQPRPGEHERVSKNQRVFNDQGVEVNWVQNLELESSPK